jgi:type II secretion system protein N
MRRLARRIGVVLLLGAAFVAGAVATFPTDVALRRLVARAVPPSGGTVLTFGHASVGAGGLRVTDLHLLRVADARTLDATWLRVAPSLWGLVRGRRGRPWHLAAALCQGTLDAALDADDAPSPLTVDVRDVDLGACLPYLLPRANVHGRLTASARGAWGGAGEGAAEVHAAVWRPGGFLFDTPIRADTGTLHWKVAARRLEVTDLTLASGDFTADGHGGVHFLDPNPTSLLDFRLTVVPGTTMPEELRRWFDAVPGPPPDARGARTFRIAGTFAVPQIVGVPAEPAP